VVLVVLVVPVLLGLVVVVVMAVGLVTAATTGNCPGAVGLRRLPPEQNGQGASQWQGSQVPHQPPAGAGLRERPGKTVKAIGIHFGSSAPHTHHPLVRRRLFDGVIRDDLRA